MCDLEGTWALELFGGRDAGQVYKLIVGDALGGNPEALYNMGAVARTYYLPIFERYVREFYLIEDLSFVYSAALVCSRTVLCGKKDGSEEARHVLIPIKPARRGAGLI